MFNYLKSLFCKQRTNEGLIIDVKDKLCVNCIEIINVIVELNVVVYSGIRSCGRTISDHQLPFQIQSVKIHTEKGIIIDFLQEINDGCIEECYKYNFVEIKDDIFTVKATAYHERANLLSIDMPNDINVVVSRIYEFPNEPPCILEQLRFYFAEAISFIDTESIIKENNLDPNSFLKELKSAYLVYTESDKHAAVQNAQSF